MKTVNCKRGSVSSSPGSDAKRSRRRKHLTSRSSWSPQRAQRQWELCYENLWIPGWGHCLWELAEVWLMACSFSPPLLPPSFKAASADFIPRPNSLDPLLVSTGGAHLSAAERWVQNHRSVHQVILNWETADICCIWRQLGQMRILRFIAFQRYFSQSPPRSPEDQRGVWWSAARLSWKILREKQWHVRQMSCSLFCPLFIFDGCHRWCAMLCTTIKRIVGWTIYLHLCFIYLFIQFYQEK